MALIGSASKQKQRKFNNQNKLGNNIDVTSRHLGSREEKKYDGGEKKEESKRRNEKENIWGRNKIKCGMKKK